MPADDRQPDDAICRCFLRPAAYLFVIMLTFLFGRSLVALPIAIGAVYWLTIAVIVRGETLSLKRKEFIERRRRAA
jgi:ABC-type dipeptide/oligopeptide/nickel transport system permease subunit